MSFDGLVWECSCGNIFRGEESPEECEKCSSLDSFMQLPEEIIKSREEDMVEEDSSVKSVKKLTSKSKNSRRKVK